jgi:hypothetical protein
MATREILKSSARVAYSVLFMFSMVFAWMLRDFAKPVISRIPCTCDIMNLFWFLVHFVHSKTRECLAM